MAAIGAPSLAGLCRTGTPAVSFKSSDGLPYARRVRLNQALPSPFEPKSTTAAERTISSPTQMHIGTFSFKEFPKVACDKGLVLDNEDRAPGKRRDASHDLLPQIEDR